MNHKRRAIRSSSGNQTDGFGSRIPIPVMNPWLTRLSESLQGLQAVFLVSNCTQRASELLLYLVGSSAFASNSDDIVFTGS